MNRTSPSIGRRVNVGQMQIDMGGQLQLIGDMIVHEFGLVLDSDIMEWMVIQGWHQSQDFFLVHEEVRAAVWDLFIEFPDPGKAIIFKLTWGGK